MGQKYQTHMRDTTAEKLFSFLVWIIKTEKKNKSFVSVSVEYSLMNKIFKNSSEKSAEIRFFRKFVTLAVEQVRKIVNVIFYQQRNLSEWDKIILF